MRNPRRPAFLLLILLAQLAAGPATVPSAPAPERGRHLRATLLQLLEQSYRRDGTWPATLPAPADPDLTYVRPAPSIINGADQAYITASATVVLHESLTTHLTGVWVGYADGHLEFAPDAATLADCQSQLPLVRTAQTVIGAYHPGKVIRPATNPARYVTLRLLDPAGQPVAGALVGSTGSFGDDFPPATPRAFVFRGPPPHSDIVTLTSDPTGHVTLAADDFSVGMTHLSATSTVPAFIFDEAHRRSAILPLSDSQFATQASLDVHLEPICTVHGHVTSLALEPAGRVVGWVAVMPFFPAGHFCQNPIESRNRSAEFSLPLPPGDYKLWIRTDETNAAFRFLHISPGQRDVNLQLDLEPIAFDLHYNPEPDIRPLIGHPAPELRSIQAWKNAAPLTLTASRGHVLLLDFWGHWCGNCVAAMPDLMKLYDEFHPQGLDVIAVHDNSVSSIQEMDRKLTTIRAKFWSNRDLPFPIALDGGQPPASTDDDHPYHGDTTNSFHIPGFPTTLVIGRDGNVLGEIDPRNPDTRARLIEYLKSPAPPVTR